MSAPRRLFVDTAVLVYAVGAEHPQRQPCRALLHVAAEGSTELHATVEALQEFLFHRLRRGSREAAVREAEKMRDLLVLHVFDIPVVDGMLRVAGSCSVGGRDAVHAATALAAGFREIVSPDRGFDLVPGLKRVEPGDATR